LSGLDRYTSILRLFSERRSAWTVADMAEALAGPQSTIYRTVHELVRQGFLEPAAEAHYRLGAAFMEFDRLIRKTDPFLDAGTSMLREVVAQARVPCLALLARLYNDTVMCVADSPSAGAPSSSYERGRPMPLTRGATSKVILAHLPARRLTKLLAGSAGGEAAPPFQPDEAALREELRAIRKRGYTVSRSEIDREILGLGAPVVVPEAGIVGSLSLVLNNRDIDDATERRLVLLVVSSASLLTEALKQIAQRPADAAEAPRMGTLTRLR
jgi:DNA-binding IclR family transcriptional regulator